MSSAVSLPDPELSDAARSNAVLTQRESGIAPSTLAKLLRVFEETPALEAVYLFGSRARGDHRTDSDIDLAVDAPQMGVGDFIRLHQQVERLGLMYRVDMISLQDKIDDRFAGFIARDRRVLWAPRRHAADVEAIGGIALKEFQAEVLTRIGIYIDEVKRREAQAAQQLQVLRAMEGMEDATRDAADFPKKAWNALRGAGQLPEAFAAQPHSSRFDGASRAIPNICLKVPTGGGKTLLAAAGVGRVFNGYLNRHTGLVLWVVPNEAIYRQTLGALADRDHPYRQLLNVAGAGRVKVLEKQSPLTKLDLDSHLCVMVLMLQSAARQSKETLRFFRDRGNVLGFLPREDDIEAHWQLLREVPNLDAYTAWGGSAEEARAQKGSIIKSSLGNVMRLVRPMVVIDEGHHAYTENALRTLDGFNPCFVLELSATPRIASAKGSGSNILVDVRGTDLDAAEMIKLPIKVDVRGWSDWQSCLGAAVTQLDALQAEADALRTETARYLRPILLVQVERTGADLRDAGFIHAEDAKAHLLQLGFTERQIAIKTSSTNDLAQPENIDLMSPTCEVRAIITKQALQEGWDCPFAYVLCALAAGRNPAAMTQLVGRILRLPQVTKTGRDALDACYVLCHDARTAEVVKGIKKALETEGMGDLAVSVVGGTDAGSQAQPVTLRRRPPFAKLRLFVPRVTWAEPGAPRRELVYESDVLAHLPWSELDTSALARDWAPDVQGGRGRHFEIGLDILDDGALRDDTSSLLAALALDRARLVRSLIDVAPNAWLVWAWVDAVLVRLLAQGFGEAALAGSSDSLIERLRIDVEAERDRLAEEVFQRLVAEGRIEFRLRADKADYELPHDATQMLSGKPQALTRDDACSIEKSLLEPALRTPDMNDLEARFAGYLDERAALRWWHRNVAKAQYGLQGWRRHKVYPDFVFARVTSDGGTQIVVVETKGLHLQGPDTDYKRALLERLGDAFRDERASAGELVLTGGGTEDVVCDLVFNDAWRGVMDKRYFSPPEPAPALKG